MDKLPDLAAQFNEQVTWAFNLSEFLLSDTAMRLGIDNTPPPDVLATLRNVLIPGMQAVRDVLGVPVLIRSGYRCPALNAAVRGASRSQHVDGHAADFVAPEFGPPERVARWLLLRVAQIKYDQLIYEGSWVHISFSPRPRNQALTATFTPEGVTYTQGITA